MCVEHFWVLSKKTRRLANFSGFTPIFGTTRVVLNMGGAITWKTVPTCMYVCVCIMHIHTAERSARDLCGIREMY